MPSCFFRSGHVLPARSCATAGSQDTKADSHRGHGGHRGHGTFVTLPLGVLCALCGPSSVVLLAWARSGTRARCARGRTRKKNLDVAAPLWLPRPFLICGKKVGGLGERHTEPRRRGTTPAVYRSSRAFSGVRCPRLRARCRSRLKPDRHPTTMRLPSSARVSREHARSTEGKAGTRDFRPSRAVVQEKTTANLNAPLDVTSTPTMPSPIRLSVIVPKALA